jgi:putative phosphoesterase
MKMLKRYRNMIGIMSDSHDNVVAVKEAVRLFNRIPCELVVHAGDFVAPFAARELEDLSCPVKAVFGNCDGEREGLKKAFQKIGEIKEAPLIFEHAGMKFLIAHLDHSLESYLVSEDLDFLIFGHTHKPEIKVKGITLLINPGEAGGWVSGRSTIALLDTEQRDAEIITL